uniref:Uncharacterized protein n=1 Tax=candidate division WOR-3 bacterium TaxID=2052148 RepID=A0A7V3ZVQ3_UNCW3
MIYFLLFFLNLKEGIIGAFHVSSEKETIELFKDCGFNFAYIYGEKDTNKMKEIINAFKDNKISLIIDDPEISGLASAYYFKTKIFNLPFYLFNDFVNFNFPAYRNTTFYFKIKGDRIKNQLFLKRKKEKEEFFKVIIIDKDEITFSLKSEELLNWEYLVFDLKEKKDVEFLELTIYTPFSDSLLKGYFDKIIEEKIKFYKRFLTKDFKIYLYLSDETKCFQYAATKYVKEKIESYSKNKITGVSHLPTITKDYVEKVRPAFLWVDIYHNIGRYADFNLPRTPNPDDTNFINFLERILINNLDSVRKYSLVYNLPFIYEAPAFSEGCYLSETILNSFPPYKKEWDDSVKSNSEDEGAYRELSEEELNCVVNLALLYGAKGIFYWHFLPLKGVWQFQYGENKGKYKYYYLNGMVKRESLELRPIGEVVKKINKRLKNLLPLLVKLKSKEVFSSVGNGRIKENSLSLFYTDYPFLHFGILENGEKYLMIVEKSCQKLTRKVKIYTKKKISLYEIIEKRRIFLKKEKDGYYFEIVIKGGEGKILKIN